MKRRRKNRLGPAGSFLHRHFLWITLAAFSAAIGWLVLLDAPYATMETFHAAPPALPPALLVDLALDPSRHEETGRFVYPYSVVPGGVASVAELQRAMAADPVVAAHYAGFDLSKARVTRSDQERMAYVSYRRGSQLYWTKGMIRLPAGERLITDGALTARARCGNQVSATPVSPTSADEPSAETLDTPQPTETSSIVAHNQDWYDPADWGSDLITIYQVNPPPAVEPPGSGIPGTPVPPVFLLPPPISAPEPPAVVPVPEPSTLLLLLTSFPAIWAFRKRQR